ncbi:MAG TPA: response regulator [Nitrospiraceae bacterium]|nr:response regulator [Nitrospiraceae bacterium]
MRGLILIIDDDFQIPGVLRARLNTIGFYVVWVHVVTILGNQWVKKSSFDGIILNIDMRHHDGMAVLQSLYKQHVAIPIIVVSHAPARERLEEGMRKGARDYIVSPFDTDLLREKCLRHFQMPDAIPHGPA